jgi:hypothetical protein
MRSDKLPARLGEQAAQSRDSAYLPVEETQHL